MLRRTPGTRPRDEWFSLLNETDQCAGRVLALDELAGDPQVQTREMVLELGDGVRRVGIAPKLSDTPGSVRRLAPVPGEHTDDILGELGVSREEIAALRPGQAVG